MAKTATKKSAPSKKSVGNTRSSTATMQKSQNTMLEKFIVDMLKDIYYAEKQLLKALPKMHKASTTQQLKDAFATHIEQTKEHVSRLDQVFEMMGKKATGKKCDAMEGLISEGQSIIEETESGSMTRDVALIIAAQKVEHYEIASYGGLVQLAKTIGMEDMAEVLAETLQEEKDTDALLTSIAENDINLQAEEEDEDTEE